MENLHESKYFTRIGIRDKAAKADTEYRWANERNASNELMGTPPPIRPVAASSIRFILLPSCRLVPSLFNMKLVDGRLVVIAGPCAIESRELCLRVGEFVRDACARLNFNYVFKASFDKANRSSGDSFRGPGMEEGLKILDGVRKELGVPVLTDVHEMSQATAAG